MFLCFSVSVQTVSAQEADSSVNKMDYFSFLEGDWEGQAIIWEKGNSEKIIKQTEEVRFKLDSTLLVVEGVGKDANGDIAFNAFATIFYDKTEEKYRMFAFTKEGQFTEANLKIKDDGKFIWGFRPGPGKVVRYNVEVSNGEWVETGEFSPDGETFHPFMKMVLHKAK